MKCRRGWTGRACSLGWSTLSGMSARLAVAPAASADVGGAYDDCTYEHDHGLTTLLPAPRGQATDPVMHNPAPGAVAPKVDRSQRRLRDGSRRSCFIEHR